MATVKARIKNAYLSEKNVDSLYEQLHSVFSTRYNFDVTLLYKPQELRPYMGNMMAFLFSKTSPKMTDDLLKNPKNTVILLNVFAIEHVVKEILARNKEKIAAIRNNPVGLSSGIPDFKNAVTPPVTIPYQPRMMPQLAANVGIDFRSHMQQNMMNQQQQQQIQMATLPSQFVSQQHQQQQSYQQPAIPQPQLYPQQIIPPQQPYQRGTPIPARFSHPLQSGKSSVSLDELYGKKKKKAVKIKKLKDGQEEHDWWKEKRRGKKIEEEEEADAAIVDEVDEQLTSSLKIPSAADYYPYIIGNYYTQFPMKLVTLSSEDRVKDSLLGDTTIEYKISIPPINLIRMSLEKVTIPVSISLITDRNCMLYFAEDDSEMKSIRLDGNDQDDIYKFVNTLEKQMNSVGKYEYSVQVNSYTKKIKFIQKSGGKGSLTLFFADSSGTSDNCHYILGFDKRDYKGAKEYEAESSHMFKAPEKIVSLLLPDFTSDPVVLMKFTERQQVKTQQFTDYEIFRADEEPRYVDSISVRFVDEDNVPVLFNVLEHTIVLRCWYKVGPQLMEKSVLVDQNLIEEQDEVQDKKRTQIANTQLGWQNRIALLQTQQAMLCPKMEQLQVQPPSSQQQLPQHLQLPHSFTNDTLEQEPKASKVSFGEPEQEKRMEQTHPAVVVRRRRLPTLDL